MSAKSRDGRSGIGAPKSGSKQRYSDVKAVVDTGASMSKYIENVESIRKNYRVKPGEIFRRMKVTTFVQLIMQVGESDFRESAMAGGGFDELDDGDLNNENERPSTMRDTDDAATTIATGRDSVISQRSTMQSVIRGVGEVDLKATGGQQSSFGRSSSAEKPFLLIDVRPKDEFGQGRIIGAVSYPSAMLARSCNNETKELIMFKNKPGKVIIVCDDDEKLSILVATTLVERGYDNIFLLSGGLKVAAKLFSKGLITGTLGKIVTGKKITPNSPMASKDEFGIEELAYLDLSLDEMCRDKRTSTRLNGASTVASRNLSSSASRTTTSAGAGRPAFKPP